MGSEVLLYGYGFVCLSMLIYNIVYSLIMRGSNKRLERKENLLRRLVAVQIDRLHAGLDIEAEHMRFLRKKLANINYLIAFDYVCGELKVKAAEDKAIIEYRRKIQRIILQLALLYRDRDNMESAYFAYFLSDIKMKKRMDIDTVLSDLLIDYMKKDSLYCRVNALQALCDLASADAIYRALRMLDMRDGSLHDKVITDVLLTYDGDSEELINLFLAHFEEFTPKIQLPIINFIRFKSEYHEEFMRKLIGDASHTKEIRLSAIRYFGKYPYESVKEQLIEIATDPDPAKWEYAATAAGALAIYTGQDVLDALMKAVHSYNWYVRYNAAESIQGHHLEYSDLLSVVSGSDRFAREMVMYRLNEQRLEEGEEYSL